MKVCAFLQFSDRLHHFEDSAHPARSQHENDGVLSPFLTTACNHPVLALPVLTPVCVYTLPGHSKQSPGACSPCVNSCLR